MFKLIVLLILARTILSSSEIIQQFRDLESTNLGGTFFDTIQIALQSREPLETVFDILRDQEQSMQQEFEKIDEKQRQIQQKCAKELKDQENVIAMIKKVLIDIQGALDEKLPDRQKKSEQL